MDYQDRMMRNETEAPKCPATINIAGQEYACTRKGPEEHQDGGHETMTGAGEKQGLHVKWGYWRVVNPPRVG